MLVSLEYPFGILLRLQLCWVHRVFWIPVSLRDSLAVATLVGAPSFRALPALQDSLAVEPFMVHRVFKGKSHFPTVC